MLGISLHGVPCMSDVQKRGKWEVQIFVLNIIKIAQYFDLELKIIFTGITFL